MVRDQLIPRLVSVVEAAEILDLTRSRVHQLVVDGHLPAARAGGTIVLAEETVRRYKAGERFPQPSQLVVNVYDEAADRWVVCRKTPVGPDYTMPEEFSAEELGVLEGQSYRAELLDSTGKVMAAVHGPDGPA